MKHYLLLMALWVLAMGDARAEILSASRLSFDTRQNPAGIQWKELKSAHFDVLYPAGLTEQAREAIALLEELYGPVSQGLKVSPMRLSVILQPHTLNSNGFVTLAPRRTEWFITPWLGPEIGQTDWVKALAVHEFRHVVQFDKSRTGFARALRFVLGEVGTAIAIGLTLPPWYLEGDAVGTETALSLSGRGRQPQFESGLRALLLDDQEWSYEQLGLESYRRWRPNHYVLGYFLTTYLRTQYGPEVLERVHAETMERAYNPLAFYNAVEKITGESFDTVYRRSLQKLKALWRRQQKRVTSEQPSELPTPQQDDWVSYSFPTMGAAGEVYALRESLSHIPQFVQVKGEQETLLWTPGPLLQDFPFKLRQGLLALSEQELHPRWGLQDFSRVKVVRMATGEVVFEQAHGTAMLPTLDHAAKRLALYHWEPTGKPHLSVRALPSGEELHNIAWKREEAVIGMDWVEGKDELVVLHRAGTYELVLSVVNLAQGSRRTLARTSAGNWAYPTCDATHVYFQSQSSGLDNIHRIPLNGGAEERVSDERVGGYQPAMNGGRLVYARYGARGMKPVALKLPLKTYPLKGAAHVALYAPLVEQEGKGDLLGKELPQSQLAETDYSQLRNFWNPHSWTLLAPPFGASVIAQVQSTNLLNTFAWVSGAEWNLNERAASGFTSLRWSYGWPMLDFGAAFGGRREEGVDVGAEEINDYWEEGSAQLGVSLPWNSLFGRWTQSLVLRGFADMLHATGRVAASRGELADNTLAGGGAEFRWDFTHRQANRDLLPPWGARLSARARSAQETERASDEESYQRHVGAELYARGLWRHHHLYGELASETQNAAGYHYASPVFFARGYSSEFLEQKQKGSLNYAFPLAYPEWAPGRYFYLKRVSLNLFYDNVWGRGYGERERFESQGLELWLDTHFVRNFYGVQWGVRFSHPSDPNEDPSAELFLNTGVARW